MKPEAQRIAIAEACGWVQRHGVWIPPSANQVDMPDYLASKDAMSEALKKLTPEQGEIFADFLLYEKDANSAHSIYTGCFRGCVATAEELAEAFLRTINEWKPAMLKQLEVGR